MSTQMPPQNFKKHIGYPSNFISRAYRERKHAELISLGLKTLSSGVHLTSIQVGLPGPETGPWEP